MQTLGTRTSLGEHRLDLVHLHASVAADSAAEVRALAPAILAVLTTLKSKRDELENAEDALVRAVAIAQAQDATLDAEEKAFSLAAKLAHAHEALFPISASAIARLPIEEEIERVKIQLAQLSARPEGDTLRAGYLPSLTAIIRSLEEARASRHEAERTLSLARLAVAAQKQAVDTVRLETWSALVHILGGRSRADAYFRDRSRRTSSSDVSDDEKPTG